MSRGPHAEARDARKDTGDYHVDRGTRADEMLRLGLGTKVWDNWYGSGNQGNGYGRRI